jgi:hypothetical protein
LSYGWRLFTVSAKLGIGNLTAHSLSRWIIRGDLIHDLDCNDIAIDSTIYVQATRNLNFFTTHNDTAVHTSVHVHAEHALH